MTVYPTATALLDEIYKSGEVRTGDGSTIKLHSQISREEGQFLHDLIAGAPGIEDTLEIGCAYGLSSLWICSALNGHHTILDPFQSTEWGGVGVANLKRAGIDYFHLIEERSEIAMPKFIEQDKKFDLIFVDGFHTFDHVMVDCFYATKLLRVDGYLVLDDADFSSIWPVIRRLETYSCFERYGAVAMDRSLSGRTKLKSALASLIPHSVRHHLSHRIQRAISQAYSMVALRKISDDQRPWDWHADF